MTTTTLPATLRYTLALEATLESCQDAVANAVRSAQYALDDATAWGWGMVRWLGQSAVRGILGALEAIRSPEQPYTTPVSYAPPAPVSTPVPPAPVAYPVPVCPAPYPLPVATPAVDGPEIDLSDPRWTPAEEVQATQTPAKAPSVPQVRRSAARVTGATPKAKRRSGGKPEALTAHSVCTPAELALARCEGEDDAALVIARCEGWAEAHALAWAAGQG